jgi:hypothetical protein
MSTQTGVRIEPGDPRQRMEASKMTGRMAGASARFKARVAGGLYLISIVGGFFAVGFIPAAIVVPGNLAATASNLLAHELLYRLGLAVHLIILLVNIPLAVIFYDLFKVVNRSLALMVAFFTLVGTAIEGVTVINQFTPLLLLEGGRYASVWTAAQIQALAYLPIQLQTSGFNVVLVFFGWYGLLTGYLIFRSSFLPRILGVLLAIGGLCYLTNSFASFLSPAFAAGLFPYIQVPSLIGEGSFCLWLTLMGVNVSGWEQQAGAARETDRSLSARAVE